MKLNRCQIPDHAGDIVRDRQIAAAGMQQGVKCHVVYMPVRNEQTRVIEWIASIIDMPERRKATEEKEQLCGMLDTWSALARSVTR
jgi:hypothetical protein